MTPWQCDLLRIVVGTHSTQDIACSLQTAVQTLGFEHYSYGLRQSSLLAQPETLIASNYSSAWQAHYMQQNYLTIDPSVAHGSRSASPIVWSPALFADAPALWDDAQSAGLRVGWAQSSLDEIGVGGMLSLSRSSEALGQTELDSKAQQLHWLTQVAHQALSRCFKTQQRQAHLGLLTLKELEVLKWIATGDSADEVAKRLHRSVDAVNCHLKSVRSKLQVKNTTAAVVQAIALGLLN
jgi:DNA-binding CsgD family transcriptional regulator